MSRLQCSCIEEHLQDNFWFETIIVIYQFETLRGNYWDLDNIFGQEGQNCIQRVQGIFLRKDKLVEKNSLSIIFGLWSKKFPQKSQNRTLRAQAIIPKAFEEKNMFFWPFPGLWENLSRPWNWNFAVALTKLRSTVQWTILRWTVCFRKRKTFPISFGLRTGNFCVFEEKLVAGLHKLLSKCPGVLFLEKIMFSHKTYCLYILQIAIKKKSWEFSKTNSACPMEHFDDFFKKKKLFFSGHWENLSRTSTKNFAGGLTKLYSTFPEIFSGDNFMLFKQEFPMNYGL